MLVTTLLLDEHAAQDFADEALRQLAPKLDLPRHRPGVQPLAAQRDQLVRRGRLALAQHDESLDLLAGRRRRHADDRPILHLWGLEQYFLDVARVDLILAGQ